MVVEDEPAIRQEICQLLRNALYQVQEVETFSNAAKEVAEKSPDLVLLDLNLPGISGYDICSRIRQQSEVPVIFLTSRTDSMDELTGMLKGADDYITKPFQPPILLARIAAVLKRSAKGQKEQESPTISYSDVILDLARGEIARKRGESETGQKAECVELTKNELKILHYLFLHPGQIVSRIDLIEYLWDQQVFIDDNTLSVNITRIRGKLKEIGVHDLIGTKRGMGYYI
ncbi:MULTISPECIES: response regulator [Dorea]|uniref:response regulator n=1 Tax=Dorea TaxID=189330 RepID=UPI000C771BD2